nr:MAG TPA: hypothetical protein [Caudoviricetes sp.]
MISIGLQSSQLRFIQRKVRVQLLRQLLLHSWHNN